MKYFWTPNAKLFAARYSRIKDINGIANQQLDTGLDNETICHYVR